MKWGPNTVLLTWASLSITDSNPNIPTCPTILNNGIIKHLVSSIFKKKEHIKKCPNKCSSVN